MTMEFRLNRRIRVLHADEGMVICLASTGRPLGIKVYMGCETTIDDFTEVTEAEAEEWFLINEPIVENSNNNKSEEK